MKELKFTFYDAIGYFVPGAFTIWALFELWYRAFGTTKLAVMDTNIKIPDAAMVGMVIVAAYVTGHLLNAIANITIDKLRSGDYPPGNYFPERFREDFKIKDQPRMLAKAISAHFGGDPPADKDELLKYIKDSYFVCYIAVAQKDSFSLAQVYLALKGLFRGMTVACLLVAVASLAVAIARNDLITYAVFIASISGGILFYLRSVRFGLYLTRAVYIDFLGSPMSALKEKEQEA